jgi:hypothetical protein
MTNRYPALEILETRCVLSGAGIPPMMEHFGDFGPGGERGGHEMRGPGLDFGGRDARPEMAPPGIGQFGPPMPRGPERDLGGFAPPPRQPMFQPANDLRAEGHEAAVIVTGAAPPPPMEAATSLPILDRPIRDTQLTSIAALSDGTLARPKEISSAASLATVESQSQNARHVESSRDEVAAPKPQAKDSPAVKVPKDDLDGLIELTANETSQRSRRRTPQAATAQTQTAADKLERLTTLSLGSREEIRRLPQAEAASRDVLAAWPASGPAWVPADAGLVEILAGDIVAHARQNSATTNAKAVLHGPFPAGLEAEINLYQAFDLALEPANAAAVTITATPQPEKSQ